MIVVVIGEYPILDRWGYPTGKKELLVSHGVDVDSDRIVVLPSVAPWAIGAEYDIEIGEYVLHD